MQKMVVRFLFSLVLLHCASFVGTVFCMEIDGSRMVFVVPDDSILQKMRTQLSVAQMKDVQKIDPLIKIVKTEKEGQRKGVCYNVAMKRCLNLTKEQLRSLKIIGAEDWFRCDVLDYFEQTKTPQVESLVIYGQGSDFIIQHCGVVNRDNTIRSKWGIGKEIFDHSLWHVPGYYGDRVVYFNLKKQFKGELGKAFIFGDLKKRIDELPMLTAKLIAAQKVFLGFACGEENKHVDNKTILAAEGFANKAYVLLKICTAFEIDVRDETHNTALMLAAVRGDLKFVQLCIMHGACKNLKNNDDKTALMLADENNHKAVVDYLKS